MKDTGIIFDVKRFAVHDGPGIRTTVFFKGCPLSCQWCHNPESRRHRPETLRLNGYHRCARWLRNEDPDVVGKEVSVDDCIREISRDVVFFDESGGGATFSGGEPLMQPAFLQNLLQRCRESDIHTAVDTSGHADWTAFETILPHTDLFLYDLKLADEHEHLERTGVGTERIHDNLQRLVVEGARVVIRIPLIPGVTDTRRNLAAIHKLLRPLDCIQEIHLLPYNTIASDKYRRLSLDHPLGRLERQSAEALAEMKSWLDDGSREIRIGG